MRKIDDLQAWRIFCAVVEANGVNAASEHLGIEPSTASRTIKGLESELGTSFFQRNTRPAALTEVGRAAYHRARALIDGHSRIVQTLQDEKEVMSGQIRVAAIAGVGAQEITPALLEYQSAYPDIDISLQELFGPAGGAFESAVAAGLPVPDVSIGYGNAQPAPGIIGRYCGEMPFVACASPGYLERSGTPAHPDDLKNHTGILLKTPIREATKCLIRGRETAILEWQRVHTFFSVSSALSAALLGAGIIPDLPVHHYLHALEEGGTGNLRLIRILPGWQRPSIGCFVYCSEQSWAKRRVRDFVEWMVEHERRYLSMLCERLPEVYSAC